MHFSRPTVIDMAKHTLAGNESISVKETHKEILTLLMQLQAKEQNEVLTMIAIQIQEHRKSIIERKRKELHYLNRHKKIGRSFWKRLFQ